MSLKNSWTYTKKEPLAYIGIFIVLLLLIVAILIVDSKTVVVLLGVIIGSFISSITTIIINKANYQKQLKLAALEKRLDAHQKAYALWREIMSNIYKDTIGKVAQKSIEWWKNHCLYLGPKSRKAFFDCIIFAVEHADMLKARNPNYDYKQEIKESWLIITKPGITLVEEVELPSFGEKELFKKLESESNQTDK